MLPWIIVCVAVCLLALLLSSKLGIRVLLHEDGVRVWVKAGFWTKQIYPALQTRKKKAEGKEKKAKKSSGKKAGRNITWDAVQRLLREIVPPMLRALGRFRRGLRIHDLEGRIVVGDRNPAAAARRYGTLNAVLWPALALLEHTVTVERRDVQIDLDFSAGKTEVTGEVFLTIRICHLAAIFLREGYKLIGPISRFLKETKAVPSAKTLDSENKTKNAAA